MSCLCYIGNLRTLPCDSLKMLEIRSVFSKRRLSNAEVQFGHRTTSSGWAFPAGFEGLGQLPPGDGLPQGSRRVAVWRRSGRRRRCCSFGRSAFGPTNHFDRRSISIDVRPPTLPASAAIVVRRSPAPLRSSRSSSASRSARLRPVVHSSSEHAVAMAAQGEPAPTADDNLVRVLLAPCRSTEPTAISGFFFQLTRHRHIAESIEMIRQKKAQLLSTLRGLSESENVSAVVYRSIFDRSNLTDYGSCKALRGGTLLLGSWWRELGTVLCGLVPASRLHMLMRQLHNTVSELFLASAEKSSGLELLLGEGEEETLGCG